MSLPPPSSSGQRLGAQGQGLSTQGQGPGVVWPPIVDAFRCFGALVGHFILRKVAAAFDDSKALVDAAGSWGGGSGGLGSLGVSEHALLATIYPIILQTNQLTRHLNHYLCSNHYLTSFQPIDD